ncbi:peptidase M16 [Clostridia bacterium]|nr:peptidase M16 [Clostridia bacterium]
MTKVNEFLDEKIVIKELSNGAKCYIIEKKGFTYATAYVTFGIGSADTSFLVNGVKTEYPCGIAHFLEHKLFEDESINVFERFAENGADVNAFTNFTNTTYYYNCSGNFYKNLKQLLSVVQTPYFTADNVEKEKGIITQEINMYKDDPFWRGYLDILEIMYKNNPIRYDIAGTVQSISKITEAMLYECYRQFYSPRNMALICVGDIDPEKIFEIAENDLKPRLNRIQKVYKEEPREVLKRENTAKMGLPRPLYNIGFKDGDLSGGAARRICANKMLIDLLAGESSPLYERLYEAGLIDQTYSIEYTGALFFGYFLISGFSCAPREVRDAVLNEYKNLQKSGFSQTDFQRIKTKHLGKLRRSFNDLDNIAQIQSDFFTKNSDIFEIADAYEKITLDDIHENLKNLSDETNSLSIVT